MKDDTYHARRQRLRDALKKLDTPTEAIRSHTERADAIVTRVDDICRLFSAQLYASRRVEPRPRECYDVNYSFNHSDGWDGVQLAQEVCDVLNENTAWVVALWVKEGVVPAKACYFRFTYPSSLDSRLEKARNIVGLKE